MAVTGNMEILQISEAVAREKNIDVESVVQAMEQAIQVAGRKKYGHEQHILAEIDRKTGRITLFRSRTVVESIAALREEAEKAAEEAGEEEVHFKEYEFIELPEAQRVQKDIELGQELREELPPIDFGRVAAQTAKQVINQKVREAERERQFEEFKDKLGEIVNGVVKRVEYGNVIVDFGRTEAMIRRDELIPREAFRTGDRIRAYIAEVDPERQGGMVVLSRVRPEFMSKLFAQEVPEIYEGLVEIVAVARDPGSRAKIAVVSHDPSVNPILSCVGVRGSRVQAVVSELHGERVDIVEYAEDPATFIVNALSSAEVSKVVLDEEDGRVEVVVADDQLSMAIGRRGQNVRLASQLTGWGIDILTEEQESDRRTEEFNRLSNMFIEALNVEEVIAHLMVTEGFTSVEEVAYVPVEELAQIEGFDEDVAGELRQRAREFLEEQQAAAEGKMKELGMSDDLINFEKLDNVVLARLGEKGIKTLDDLADLAADELREMLPDLKMREDQLNEIIMAARAHWFEDEQPANDDSASGDNSEEAAASA